MKKGYLSQYFEAVAAKRLSAVEVNSTISHQHEFNGSQALKQVFGTHETGERLSFPTRFIWMGEEHEAITADGTLSWYNSRHDKPRAPEYRLYFPTTEVSELARAGDLLFIAKRTDQTVLSIIVTAGSTMENQLTWLFGVPIQDGRTFIAQEFNEGEDKEVDFAVRFILEELGIDVEEPEADYFDDLLQRYQGRFPQTNEFSLFARESFSDVSPLDEPDKTLMKWMNQEEKLFRRLERQLVDQRLRDGFVSNDETDIDGFLSFSLSVQNRRKKRAGTALENHLEEIFRIHGLTFTRNAETENGSTADFLFPGRDEYFDPTFPTSLLTMLGVKTSCKDRWRQVLAEANRIDYKHLFTLEPGITESQTNEMRACKLQLVLPYELHDTYKENQRTWLMNVKDFINLTSDRQKYKGQ